MKNKIFITGVAGFIGYHLCKRLLSEGKNVIGLDNLNSFYDVKLKKARLDDLYKLRGDFNFFNDDLENINIIEKIFKENKPAIVFNLAAQAGVRYSIENPDAFTRTNILGFNNLLSVCSKNNIKHIIYASSSAVYGGNTSLPYSEKKSVDHPVSIYAATKKANELYAHCYSHLYSMPMTGLRFFTVYGPWGRPDMAYFLFTKSIFEDKKINIYNYGEMYRDFTFIDDIIESLTRVMNKPPELNKNFDKKNPSSDSSWAPHRIFNIGNSNSIKLIDFIEEIEKAVGKKANKIFLPMQKGDVESTQADTKMLEDWINFKPNTDLNIGLEKFVNWYKEFYDID